jgi:hypothetical protein
MSRTKTPGLHHRMPGPATRLTVTVKAPATRHQLTMAMLVWWLGAPNYQRPVGRVATGGGQLYAEFGLAPKFH